MDRKVRFIATRYKKQSIRVNFYTKDGERVDFSAVKRVPKKERVEFVTKKSK